tara:strand:+ start:233 stop:334 length:102 start_codon:yes stop_codon:yes gene_type:complete
MGLNYHPHPQTAIAWDFEKKKFVLVDSRGYKTN